MNRSVLPTPGLALLAVALVGLAGLSACGGGKKQEATMDDAASRDPSFTAARRDYKFYCAACHGRDGRGAPHLFPPLRGSAWLNGEPGIPIRIVLHGLRGEITVEGQRFMNQMPPLGLRLDDAKAAEILTFARTSWGNDAPAVTAAEVASVRAATADRTKPFTPEEIEALRSPAP
jgi:mono/diheme cytochrome c family protein